MKLLLIAATALTLSLGTGRAVAQDFDKGANAYEAGDFNAALAEWLPLAEQGDAAAQTNVGLLYSNGFGVEQDYEGPLGGFVHPLSKALHMVSSTLLDCILLETA